MDQGPLVIEQINAGAKLASEFAMQYKPLQAAFWLKESEDEQWFLYLASDQIDDSNFDLAYGEVLRLLGPGPHMWLDPFQVKVTGIDDPVVKDVIDIGPGVSPESSTPVSETVCSVVGVSMRFTSMPCRTRHRTRQRYK